MKVYYKDDYIKKLFDDLRDPSKTKKIMQKKISVDILRILKKRFDQLLASPNFYFIIDKHIGKCESLTGNMKGKYAIHVSANYQMIICPNVESFDSNSLKKCEEFCIEGVVDYHGTKQIWIIP
ncbi:MAG: hypothetical protein IJX78_06855 [Bacilli bacterium]|nr:hypothetical protein [Bacilli bacterium]